MKDFTLDDIRKIIEDALKGPPTGDAFLDDRYAAHIDKFYQPLPYYRVLYHLARRLRPALTVELGAWQATGAAHFAGGWKPGEVWTIDHHTDPGDEVHKEKAEEAERHYANLNYLRGWTWDMKKVISLLDKRIDILFIDSWHKYDYARRDWEDYSPLLASPALVICDDIMAGEDGPVIAGMRRFWDELPGEKFLDEQAHPGSPMGFLKWV